MGFLLKAEEPHGIEARNPEAARPQQGRNRFLPDDPNEFRATLVEHLEELRDRIIRSLGILCGGWLVGWFLEKPAYGLLNSVVLGNITKQVNGKATVISAFNNATEPFMLKLKLSLMIGVIIALPLVLLQLWGFIRPGLKPAERRPIERIAPFTLVLFATGVGFSWLILGPAIRWFSSYLEEFPGTQLIQDPGIMIAFCLKMMLAFGIGFQLPLIVYALGAMNLLSAETLVKHWRHASVVIFIVAAALTPSNDAFSMLMMAIPLVILFMISVWAVKLTQGRKKALAEAEAQATATGVEQ